MAYYYRITAEDTGLTSRTFVVESEKELFLETDIDGDYVLRTYKQHDEWWQHIVDGYITSIPYTDIRKLSRSGDEWNNYYIAKSRLKSFTKVSSPMTNEGIR